MSKCCGTCARSRTNNVDGTVCSKSGKPVSYLAVYDCWTDQGEPDPAPLTKVCQRCGRELPLENFGRHVRTKDGYQPLCRECLREANTGKRKRQPWKTPEEVEAEKAQSKEPKTRGRKVSHPDKVVDGVTQCKACRTKNEHERRVRRREAKKEQELQAAAHEAVEAVKKVLDEQPRVNAPAGGLRLPERLEKTVPKVVIEKGPSIGDKVKPITPLEKFETAEIVEELRRRGFRCIIWMEV